MSEDLNQNNDSIDPERIIEAIEACRPGSDDAADESLSFIADHADFIDFRSRIEQIDTRIKNVFADVPVPDGLESRILAALAHAPAPASAEDIVPADHVIPSEVQPKPRRPYRRWYVGASAMVVAASLLVALFLHMTAPPPLVEQSLIETAMSDFETPLDGSPLGNQWPAAVKKFQPSTDLSLFMCKAIHWKKLNDFLDRQGVVYSFITPENAQARLYVLDSPGKIDLPELPPGTPQGNTGGILVAAWQTADRLYVLVIRGDRNTYYGLIPSGPLT